MYLPSVLRFRIAARGPVSLTVVLSAHGLRVPVTGSSDAEPASGLALIVEKAPPTMTRAPPGLTRMAWTSPLAEGAHGSSDPSEAEKAARSSRDWL